MCECGPHAHCADRTPHSHLRKICLHTVTHILLSTLIVILWRENFCEFFFLIFWNFYTLNCTILEVEVLCRCSHPHTFELLTVRVWVRVQTAHQNEVCAWWLSSSGKKLGCKCPCQRSCCFASVFSHIMTYTTFFAKWTQAQQLCDFAFFCCWSPWPREGNLGST